MSLTAIDSPSQASAFPLPIWTIVGAGLGLAMAMALSPMTLLLGVALTLAVSAGCRGLTGRERQMVLGVLIAAVLFRVLAIAALFMSSAPGHVTSFSFDGDGWYMKQRSLWIRNVWLGTPVDPTDFQHAFEAYGWTSYIYVLAYLQYLVGPAPYGIHLLNVFCFVLAAILLHRIAREAYGPIPALVALTVMLFLPTLFVWSVTALKESLYLLLLTIVLVGVLKLARGGNTVEGVVGLALIVGSTMALNTVRVGAMLIVVAAIALTVAGTFVSRRPYLLVLVLLVAPVVGLRIVERPAVQERLLTQLQASASLHLGNVHTQGHGYKLLDQRFYSGDPLKSMTWPEAQRFVMRAVVSIIVVPLPWDVLSKPELLFLPQQLMWYGLVVFGVIGLIEGCQGDVFITWLFLGMIVASAAVIAPNEGNVGTMVRHRDSLVPFVSCLSAVGGLAVLVRLLGLKRYSVAASNNLGYSSKTVPVFFSRTVESSIVAQWLTPVLRGSYLCRFVATVVRPTIGYDASRVADLNRRSGEALARMCDGSRLVATIVRGISAIRRGWSEAAAASVVGRVRSLESWQRYRLVGWTLLIGAVGAGVLGPLGDQAWPSAFAWSATIACAVGLIAGARRLATARSASHA